ncbi:MAG: protein kinase [Acidobacteria bacterium]|nr:protein kinase [Acidobacteriota bacterium]
MTGAERPGAVLAGRYRVEREIGRGGMAVVYLAHDLRHGRLVAVKVLGEHLAPATGRERFLREIAIAANLAHPHILPLHDSGEADGRLFYVMPYVAGDSLRARLRRERQLPVEEALHVAREVGDALAYAHRHGVVHRDVKPENVLLADGHALLADFGIARAAVTSGITRAALTGAGMALGTVEYMSPEQASGEPDIGPGSDQYALACVVYEMLTGEVPFSGPTPQSVIARRLAGTPAPLRALRASVPRGVEAAVTRALARDAVDRFSDVADFVGALASAAPAPVQSRRPELSIAVLPFANLSQGTEDDFFSDGITEDIITQLSKISALKVVSRTSVMRFKQRTRCAGHSNSIRRSATRWPGPATLRCSSTMISRAQSARCGALSR